MLGTDQLAKQFGENTAVDAANINVVNPAIIGILGRSDAGKSTLLRILNRVANASEGSGTFEGEEITGSARRRRTRVVFPMRDDLSAIQQFAADGRRL